ncbi:MAG TPA: tetratricopeptide repeat protein, partial [Phototrophicaceae bacterium]|nr:tetratricopeptide repeat protein [Phototrophicaceae bacterium]
ALARTTDGASSAWLIGGESGVGKSRLLDELRARAMVSGAIVVRGQGIEGGGVPYQLWRDPLRRLALVTELTDLEAGIIKPLVPDIAELLGREIPVAPHLDAKGAQQRLILTIVSIFKRQPKPVVLMLEDLQWAGESLAVLQRLTELISESSLMVIGTYRDDEKPDLPTELAGMQVIKLPRLSDEAIARLSESMLGQAGTQPHLIDLLKRETEGNTLFMVEVVRTLAEESGRLSDIAFMTLPERVFAGGIQQVIRRRLSRVPASLSNMLRFAAVLGRQLDLQVLTFAYPDAGEVDHFVTSCAGAAVLEIVDDRWRFTHDKLRETILYDLTPEERPILHRAVAEALEHTHPDDPGYADTLVEHWYAAGDVSKTLDYTLIACERLVAFVSEFAPARHLISRGLALTDQLPPDQSNQYRAKLLGWSGNAYERQGSYPEAKADYLACLELAQADSKLTIQALHGLASLAIFEGNHLMAREYVEQTIPLAKQMGNDLEFTRTLNHLGIIAYNLGEYDAAKAYHEQSLANDIAGGYRIGVARNLNSLGLVVSQMGDFTAARDYYEQSLVISREIGDRTGVAYSLGNLGNITHELADYPAAMAYTRQSMALKQEMGDQLGIAISLNNLGDMAIRLGDIQMAQVYLVEGLEKALEIKMYPLLLEMLINFAVIRLTNGDLARAGMWLGLVTYHPATFAETLNGVGRLLRTKLEALTTESQLSALMEAGKKLDLNTVLQQILADYQIDPS